MNAKGKAIAVTSVSSPGSNQRGGATLPTSKVPVELLRKYSSPKPIRVAHRPKKTT
jgi:hypothetical protein